MSDESEISTAADKLVAEKILKSNKDVAVAEAAASFLKLNSTI